MWWWGSRRGRGCRGEESRVEEAEERRRQRQEEWRPRGGRRLWGRRQAPAQQSGGASALKYRRNGAVTPGSPLAGRATGETPVALRVDKRAKTWMRDEDITHRW